MKLKFILQISTLIVYSLIFSSMNSAQEKPVAVKVAEYNDKSGNIKLLTEASDKFAESLSKESQTTKGFIAFFSGSSYLGRYVKRYDEIFDSLEAFLKEDKYSIKEKTKLTQGGRLLNYSDFARVEFWIVPENAENPDIRANACGLFECPTLALKGEETIKNVNELHFFTANVSGGSAGTIEYNWTVSAGEIIEGQGTPTIKVDFSKAKIKEIKISVKLDGVPEECSSEALFTTKIQ